MRTTPEQAQEQIDQAKLAHYAAKLRAETPDLPGDTSDEELIRADYGLARHDVPDMTPDEYWKALGSQYDTDFKPPKIADQRTLMEKAQDVGHALAPAGEGLAANVGAGMLAHVLSKATPAMGRTGVANVALGGYYGAKLLNHYFTGRDIEQTLNEIPSDTYRQLHNHFSLLMQHSKLDPAHKEAVIQRSIHNVVYGRTATQQSLASDVEQTGAEGQGIANEAVANTLVNMTPIGATNLAEGAAANVAGRGLARAGVTGAAANIATKAAQRAASGALFAGTFGGLDSAALTLENEVQQGRGADDALGTASKGLLARTLEVGGKSLSSFGEGFGQSWRFGAVLGGALGAGEGALGAAVGNAAIRQRNQAAAVNAAKLLAVEKFGDDFKPQDLDTHFDRQRAAADAQGLNDVQLATNIVSDLHPDVAGTPEGMRAIATIAQRIGTRRALEGNTVALPKPEGVAPIGTVPVGADINATGGMAPEPNTPAAVQGPISEQQPQPGIPSNVRRVNGLEPNAPAGQQPVPLELQSTQPEGLMPPAARLSQPLPVTGAGPGAPPAEIAPRDLGPSPVTPTAPGTPPPSPLAVPGPPQPGLDTRAGQIEAAAPQTPTAGLPTIPGLQTPEAGRGAVPGQAPEPHEPVAVQGPVGEQFAQTPAPEKVQKLSGLEGNAPPGSPVARATAALQTEPVGTKPGRFVVEGARVEVHPSETGNSIEIRNLQGAGVEGATPGASTRAIQRVNAEADRAGVPVDVTLAPVKKGDVPLAKLVEWYKSHGYEVVEQGDGWAQMRRQPVSKDPVTPAETARLSEDGPGIAERVAGVDAAKAVEAAGNVEPGKPMIKGKAKLADRVQTQLDLWGDAADKRLKKNSGKLMTGIDPADMRDLVVSAAAKMYRLGLRSTRLVGKALVDAHGDYVKPHLNEIISRGRRVLLRVMGQDGPTLKRMRALLAQAEEGRLGHDWYNQTWDWLKEHFGDDAEMMARFISATSFGNSTDGNATMALRAYAQWKLGLPFDGYQTPAQKMSLYKAVRGEVFGDGKAQGFLGALTGDENAVALDRWMMRALGFQSAGTATGRSALASGTYKLFATIIRQLASEVGMTPREFQAAVWTSEKMRKVQRDWKVSGPSKAAKTGSFRPMEALIGARLNGLSPMEWVRENRLTFDKLKNASDGALQARGEYGGWSFNPYTFAEHRAPGYIVTLDTRVVPEGEASGRQVINFAHRYRDLIDKYHGVVIGLFNMGEAKPGHVSMDFNIQLPNHPDNLQIAKQLGFEGRQLQIGHIDTEGNYTGHDTGYNIDAHGPQFESRSIRDIDAQMEALGVPQKNPNQLNLFAPAVKEASGRIELQPEVLDLVQREPMLSMSRAAESAHMTLSELEAAADHGRFTPMSDAGVAGSAYVTEDGTVFRYVDPKGPSYNMVEVLGTLLSNKRHELLDKLQGMDIIGGHDVIERFRSQSGHVRLAAPEPPAGAEQAKLTTAIISGGGKIVSPAAIEKITKGGMRMDSFWITPLGRLIHLPGSMHQTSARDAIRAARIPSVKGYEGSAHGAGSDVQALLNRGFIRMQASGNMVAFDVSASITARQRALMKTLIGNHDWAAAISNDKGALVHGFASHMGDKPHHFLAKASGN